MKSAAQVLALSMCLSISPQTSWGLGGNEGGDGGSGGWSGGGPGNFFGGDGGGDLGPGCCGIPEELEEHAKALRDQFLSENYETLLDRQILGSLCENYKCGDLSEVQASLFLDRMIAGAREAHQWWSEFWAWIIAAAGLVIAAGSLWVSVLALRQSNRNEREIGQLQGQMERSGGETP